MISARGQLHDESEAAAARLLDPDGRSSLVEAAFQEDEPALEVVAELGPYLFMVVSEAGRLDPGDRAARSALAQRVSSLASLLESHAHHEDEFIQPVIETYQPRVAEIVAGDHARFEVRLRDISEMALGLADEPGREVRFVTQQLYLEMASFTTSQLVQFVTLCAIG